MPASFLVVPQWQGSRSSRAMRLIDGAEAIRGDLPSAATTTIEVPLGAGDAVGTGVHRASAVLAVRERLTDALDALTDGVLPVVVGGDCGVELGAVEHALAARPGLALVWLDAHGDLQDSSGSPSGSFSGMVVRALLGEAPEPLAAPAPLSAERLVLAGVRALDPEEEQVLERATIRLVPVDALSDPPALAEAVAATGADAVYVHVDLDVLDPEDVAGVDSPEPFGVRTAALVAAIRALGERLPVVGAGITGFAPASAADARDDLPTILRLLSALTAGARG